MTGPDNNIAGAMQQAIAHHQGGRVHDAIPIYREVLASQPENPDALHLLGLAMRQQGDSEAAVSFLEKAVAVKPGVAPMHSNLGNAYRDTGRDEQALEQYETALDIDPDYQDAWYNLGNACRSLGKFDQAIDAYERALAIDPRDAQAWHNKAITEHSRQNLDAAIQNFQAALKARPGYAAAHFHLANALDETGRHDDAIRQYRAAVKADPGSERYWRGLARAIQFTRFSGFDTDLKDLLIDCFSKPGVDYQHLSTPALSIAMHDPVVGAAFTLSEDWPDKNDAARVLDDLIARLDDPLLLALLSHCIVADQALEVLLLSCRRALLNRFAEQPELALESCDLCAVLAAQCWLNEYVWHVTDREQQKIKTLVKKLKESATQWKSAPAGLFLLACYAPLLNWFDADELLNLARGSDDRAFQELVKSQISEPQIEAGLMEDTRQICPASDSVSKAVQKQYEENPYPRWEFFTRAEAKSVAHVMHEIFPNRPELRFVSPDEPRILVAGCGTGRNAFETAARFANSTTLAIDLSIASLAYARRKAEQNKLSNIEFAQADILALTAGPDHIDIGKFDIIDCTGVLHHMAQPEAGWKVLNTLLEPGGLMRIGLYSELARQPVAAARKLIEEQDLVGSVEHIREFRRKVFSLDSQHPARPVAQSRDFFSLSLCRDLLFHVQEQRSRLPDIKEIIQRLNMEFLGFELGFADTRQKYRREFVDDPEMANLDNWNEYEKTHPDTFVGMYQFWLRKI